MPAESEEAMPTFVFLHGAGTGAWVWSRVQRELSLPAVALDVPGRHAGASPESASEEIVAELDRRGIDDVVLVLHSLAGVLASGLAARLGSRLRRIVYVSAVIPPAGGSFVDTLGFVSRLVLRLLFRFNPNGLKPPAAMIRRELCNDLSEEDADLVVSRYEAEMPGLYLTPVGAPPVLPGSVYVKLLRDRSVMPSQQDAMVDRLEGVHVQELDAGHLVMLSQPAALAEILSSRVERSTE